MASVTLFVTREGNTKSPGQDPPGTVKVTPGKETTVTTTLGTICAPEREEHLGGTITLQIRPECAQTWVLNTTELMTYRPTLFDAGGQAQTVSVPINFVPNEDGVSSVLKMGYDYRLRGKILYQRDLPGRQTLRLVPDLMDMRLDAALRLLGQPKPEPTPQSFRVLTSYPESRQYEIQLDGREEWRPLPITVHSGDVITIYGFDRTCLPAGPCTTDKGVDSDFASNDQPPFPNAPLLALMARIGSQVWQVNRIGNQPPYVVPDGTAPTAIEMMANIPRSMISTAIGGYRVIIQVNHNQ